MARDLVITAGIKFDPKDVDTSAIKDAIIKSLANAELRIAKVVLGADAKAAVQDSFSKTQFSVSKAKLDSSAKVQLQDAFSKIDFVIQQARFGAGGINGLKNSLNQVQLILNNAKIGAQAQTAIKNAFSQPTTTASAGTGGSVAAASTAAASASKTATDRFREQSAALKDIVDNTSSAEKANRNYLQSLIATAGSAETFGVKIGQITTRFAAYLVALKAILAVQSAVSESFAFIFQFDSALQDLQKVLQTTPEGLSKVTAGLFDVANATGKAVTDVAASFGEFIRTGVGAEEALKRTKDALIGVNITGLSLEESTKLITSSLVVFKDEIKSGIQAIDLLTVADINAAASSAEIARGILRSGSAAEAVGISFKQLTALTAATIESTQLSGSTIGSAFKTLFANIAKSEVQVRETANAFGAGVQAGDSFFTILNKIADIFPVLGTAQKSQLSVLLSGSRRFTELTGLLGNFGKVNELVAKENNAAGTAIERNQAELDKLSTKAVLATTAFQQLIVELTNIDKGANGAGNVRNILADTIDVVTKIGHGLTQVVQELKAFALGSFSAASVFTDIAKAGFFAVAPGIIKGITTGLLAFFKTSLALPGALNQIAASTQKIATAQTEVNTRVSSQLIAEQAILRLKQQQASVATGQSGGIVSKITGGIDRGATALNNNKTAVAATSLIAIDAAGAALEKFTEEVNKNGSEIEKLAASFGKTALNSASLGLQIGFLAGPIAGFGIAIANAAVKLSIDLLGSIKTQSDAIKAEAIERRASISALQTLKGKNDIVIGAFQQLNKSIIDTKLGFEQTDQQGGIDSFVNELDLAAAIVAKLGDKTNGVADTLESSTAVLSNTIENVARQIRAVALDKEIAKVRSELRGQAIDFTAQIKFGDASKEFAPLRSAIKEAFTVTDFNSALSDEKGTLQEINNLLAASNAFTGTGSASALQTLQTYNALGPVLESALSRQKEQSDAIERQLAGIKARNAEEEQALKLATAFAQEHKKDLDTAGKDEGVRARSNERQKILNDTLAKANGLGDQIRQTIENQAKAEQTLLGFDKDLEETSKARIEAGNKIIANIVKQAETANLIPLAIEAEIRSLRDANSLRESEANIEKSIADIQIGHLNILQERESTRALLTQKSQAEERKITKEFENQISLLEEQAKQVQGTNPVAASQLTAAANAARNAQASKIKEVREKAAIELGIELNKQDIENVKKAEGTLLDFRINAIKEITSLEIESSNRRIDAIKKLSETTGGRQFLQQEFKPTNNQVRDLGFTGSILAKQLEEQTGIAVKGMLAELDTLKSSGADDFKILEVTRENQSKLAKRSEEETAGIREIILNRLKDATEVVSQAEQNLVDARNKIPALNGQVIEAEKKLATASADIEKSTDDLFRAYQNAADAQFRLNAEVSIAEFKARQATGAFGGIGEQIGALNGIFGDLQNSVKASASTILEVRKQIISEEISLLQGQFNTFKSLAVEAATGGPEAASKITGQIAAAQAIAKGASVSSIPPEFLQGIDRLFGVVDGLEAAITKQGLQSIGLPADTLNQIGGNIVGLSKQSAESGKSQVDQAVEQVKVAQQAVAKAEEQKVVAEQELEVQRITRDNAVKAASIAGENLGAVRGGFRDLVNITSKELEGLNDISGVSDSIKEAAAINKQSQDDILGRLDRLIEVSLSRQSDLSNLSISAITGGAAIAGAANGTLSSAELFGVLSAARREKGAMPAGSRLMLANTSEVVLTRRQAQMFGLNARPLANAATGNAVSNNGDALGVAINALLNKLNQPGFVQQNITVQLDQNRSLEVKGLDGIDAAIRAAFEERVSRLATKEEQDAISDVVQSIVSRLNEQGIVNSNGF